MNSYGIDFLRAVIREGRRLKYYLVFWGALDIEFPYEFHGGGFQGGGAASKVTQQIASDAIVYDYNLLDKKAGELSGD